MITKEKMEAAFTSMLATWCRKNQDYGDSFGITHRKYGKIAGMVRIADKFNRLIALNNRATPNFESERDTLLDLATYCVMQAVLLDDDKIHAK